jgi:hypothetical protein
MKIQSSTPREAQAPGRLSRRGKQRIAVCVVAFVTAALTITALRGGVTVGTMDMTIDPVFRIPAPPRDIEWWPTGTYISIAIVGVADLLLIAMGVRDYLRTQSLILYSWDCRH